MNLSREWAVWALSGNNLRQV